MSAHTGQAMRRATIRTVSSNGDRVVTLWDGRVFHSAVHIGGGLRESYALEIARKWVRPRDRCRWTMEQRAAARLERRFDWPVAMLSKSGIQEWIRIDRAMKAWWGRHARATAEIAELLQTKEVTP